MSRRQNSQAGPQLDEAVVVTVCNGLYCLLAKVKTGVKAVAFFAKLFQLDHGTSHARSSGLNAALMVSIVVAITSLSKSSCCNSVIEIE